MKTVLAVTCVMLSVPLQTSSAEPALDVPFGPADAIANGLSEIQGRMDEAIQADCQPPAPSEVCAALELARETADCLAKSDPTAYGSCLGTPGGLCITFAAQTFEFKGGALVGAIDKWTDNPVDGDTKGVQFIGGPNFSFQAGFPTSSTDGVGDAFGFGRYSISFAYGCGE